MLQETVDVWDMESLHKVGMGVLVRGYDGLPSFCSAFPTVVKYTPATLPAVWSLRAPRNTWPGPLLTAWQEIEHIREEIAIAEREVEGEDDKS